MAIASILWKRLDTPGHDACHLDGDEAGWKLHGTTVFRHDGVPARLTYQVVCDSAWHTLQGRVEGWFGAHPVAFNIARTYTGGWTLNGQVVPSLENCVDLDPGSRYNDMVRKLENALPLAPGSDVHPRIGTHYKEYLF